VTERIREPDRGGPRPVRNADEEAGAPEVLQLLGLLRASRIYDLSNQVLRQQVLAFLARVAGATEGELTLVAMGQACYVNGSRVRARGHQSAAFESLSREFERQRVGGVRFLSELRPDELGAFLRIWHDHVEATGADALATALAGAGVLHASLITLEELAALSAGLEDADAHPPQDEHERARVNFARAVRGTRSALTRAAKTGRPAMRPIKRLVQPIVDSILQNEYSIIGLTAIKDHDEYTYAHCVNVSILSIGMGQQLGLSRVELSDLGVAAVLHDLGKLHIPPQVLGKSGKLDEAEWTLMRRHPIEGMRMVLGLPGLTPLTLKLIRVCLQHHLVLDGTGYPTSTAPAPLSTASRIVTVADCFDALTSHRSYRARPFTGYEALKLLLAPERKLYDLAVLWALIKTVGLYPAGTLLLTTCGHVVVSLGGHPEDIRRPRCRVLAYPDGTMPLESEPEIWSPMPRTMAVARVVHPDEFDFEVDRLLAA